MSVETGETVEIRSATSADFEGVLPMLRQLWPNKDVDADGARAVFDRCIASDNYVLLCAEAGSSVVGFCFMMFRESLWQQGQVAYMEVLVVDADLRSQGIGAAMMDRATQQARSRGCKVVELDSALHRDRAHAFYERLGFKKDGYAFWREI